MNTWEGDFGRAYTDRNPQSAAELNALYLKDYGKTATQIYTTYWSDIPKNLRILEVGCNVGCQLEVLQGLGYTNLCGLDIQWYAVEKARSRLRGINIMQGDARDIPFKTGLFDLVFTAGLLIHIAPPLIKTVTKEIVRCSSTYVWGFECFSETHKEVIYRGQPGMMWTGDFSTYYPWTLIAEDKVQVLDHDYYDQTYLLRRP